MREGSEESNHDFTGVLQQRATLRSLGVPCWTVGGGGCLASIAAPAPVWGPVLRDQRSLFSHCHLGVRGGPPR
eukprot:9469927-Pyramimonas_sp.AAC.1